MARRKTEEAPQQGKFPVALSGTLAFVAVFLLSFLTGTGVAYSLLRGALACLLFGFAAVWIQNYILASLRENAHRARLAREQAEEAADAAAQAAAAPGAAQAAPKAVGTGASPPASAG